MKSVVILLVLGLAVGVLWGPAPAQAGEQPILQQAALAQPVSDAELCEMNGKFCPPPDLCRLAYCIYSKLPQETQQQICTVVRTIRCITHCCRTNGNNPR